MRHVRDLLKQLKHANHPGAPIVQAAVDCSNSPEFISTIAHILSAAATRDINEHKALMDSLSRKLYEEKR